MAKWRVDASGFEGVLETSNSLDSGETGDGLAEWIGGSGFVDRIGCS